MEGLSTNNFTVGLVQMCTGNDLIHNINQAEEYIHTAVEKGAQFVMTPEQTSLMELSNDLLLAKTTVQEEDIALQRFSAIAKNLNIYLLIGSLAIRNPSNTKLYNRSFLLGPDGHIITHYDKLHMFDIQLENGESYKESQKYQAGQKAAIADLPWGILGMTICYDLRFPHLYRQLAQKGAQYISIPSAFTQTTGRAHWEILLRARAIENGCYIFAPAQSGIHDNKRQTYGHSMIVSPWGDIVAQAQPHENVIVASIDTQFCQHVRKQIPSLQHDNIFTF